MKEMFEEQKKSLSVRVENDRVEEVTFGFQAGLAQRLVSGAGQIDFKCRTRAVEKKSALAELPLDRLVSAAREISGAARSFSRLVRQVRVSCQLDQQNVTIENSGRQIRDRRERYYLAVEVVAGKDGQIQKARTVEAGSGKFSAKNLQQLGRVPARRACNLLTAPMAPAGTMPVVLSGEAGGTMIHEACGHGLEADFIARNISRYAGQLNKKVAAAKITVMDDPTLKGLYGSYKYDDEGTPARPVVLIEKGILKNYLTDIYFGNIIKMAANGHGRRQSFRSWPVPRMSNTFVANGPDDAREMLASLKNGLFIKKLGGGQVDVVSGDFVFEIEEGYLVLKGKIKHQVARAILMGNGPEVLRTCDAVAGDLSFSPGICGKDDAAPVTSGQPSLRIPEILVGGMGLN